MDERIFYSMVSQEEKKRKQKKSLRHSGGEGVADDGIDDTDHSDCNLSIWGDYQVT